MDMRLLICTQTVDSADSNLGFFHRWIEEFAKHCEHIIVVCLRKGSSTLPRNVEVISLGDRHRVLRAFELCGIAFGRRTEYDTVFVHMNPEYIVAAGWLWRVLGKRIGQWYVHKAVNLKLRIAEKFAHVIFTASKESFRLSSAKVFVVGHGIDVAFFVPDRTVTRKNHILSVGRLDISKNHDLVIRAAKEAGRPLRVVGGGLGRTNLERLAGELRIDVTFVGGIPQHALRNEYRTAAVLVHTSETGAMDKVVLEALATDCPVVTTSAVYGGFPVETAEPKPASIAAALTRAMSAPIDRVTIVREKHSLSVLVPRILQKL